MKKRPAEKILVVSDNAELSCHLMQSLAKNPLTHTVRADYRFSAGNSQPQPMMELGATAIDMKDGATIQTIIAEYDLVLSLHCRQVFPEALVGQIRCINVHPGYNPYNRGFYPQVFSIINGLPAGVTIHVMDAQIDHGAIIAQKKVTVEISDTSLDVYRKIIEAEKELIDRHIGDIVSGDFRMIQPAQEGNYHSLKDFRMLCKLDLANVATLGEHLNLLRALTHGDFRNAFFVDANGDRYFVRLSIEKEDR